MRSEWFGLERGAPAEHAACPAATDPVRRAVAILPRPLRFLGVGGLGLLADLGVFTLAFQHGLAPLVARLLSLGLATLLTWRLNRALTFDHTGRRPGAEAFRYAAVTATAQALSYGVFAALTLTALSSLPQLALFVGAAAAAGVSYTGHALLSFRPCERIAPQGVA